MNNTGPRALPLPHSRIACILCTALLAHAAAIASDWPMWRQDPAHRASSDERLPESLALKWVLELPEPRPAWPATQDKLQFDRLYEPVLAAKTLFVPSMLRDKLTAYDIETGKERWRFYADGPVRFAAAYHNGKVYFGSDDGRLYCLRAQDGSLVWKFRAGGGDRWILGQQRFINMWPVRGAPVIHEGKVYVAAGIWPFLGVFVHALDAETGSVVWTNSGTGSMFLTQQHFSEAFAAVAPQGYMAVSGSRLIVPGGRTLPAVFDLETGRMLHLNLSSRSMGSKGGGGYEVFVGDSFYINRGRMYRLDNGTYVAPASATVLTDTLMLGAAGGKVLAYPPGWKTRETVDRRGKKTVKLEVKSLWTSDAGEPVTRVFMQSGGRIYAAGKGGRILAIDLPGKRRRTRVSWKTQIPDIPLDMICGDGKLLVSTDRGRIYCFGADSSAEQIVWIRQGASWKYLDGGRIPPEDWKLPSFDDTGWPSGPSQLGYGDDDEATKLSFGKDRNDKALTYYFRRRFRVSKKVDALKLKLLVDDGAVVYLNGKEILRLFMPEGSVDHKTKASKVGEGNRFHVRTIAHPPLLLGDNILAVEVHQASRKSSDISFDFELSLQNTAPEEGAGIPPLASGTLVPRGAPWKYSDGGKAVPPEWIRPDFDDGAWRSGKAPLGYGESSVATRLRFGNNSKRKALAYHFRHAFTTREACEDLSVKVDADDGAVVYLDGKEIGRINMPQGPVDRKTRASERTEPGKSHEIALKGTRLEEGRHVVAIEVHQVGPSSSDVFLDLEMTASAPSRETPLRFPEDSWTSLARSVLEKSGVRDGYCLALGLGTGRLAEEVAAQSNLHVIVLEPDRSRLDSFRRRLDALGAYGARIAAVPAHLDASELPPYLANLIVSEDPSAAGLGSNGAFLQEVFRCLRPFSGIACLALTSEQHAVLEQALQSGGGLDRGVLERSGDFSLVKRLAAPAGSANWTHQYGDASKTVSSRDTLVKAPLGLLWFGGPSHEGVLPRHGHGPSPQVVDGRLFIEGRDMLRATDIYTGRLLWETRLPDLGLFFDNTLHQPGANATGSNYVSMPDGVYVIYKKACLRLDPATGKILSRYELPALPGGEGPPELGFVAAWGKYLVLGASSDNFVPTAYTAGEFRSVKPAALKKIAAAIKTWRGFQPIERKGLSSDAEHVRRNLNKLLVEDDMVEMIPPEARKKAGTGGVEEQIRKQSGNANDAGVRSLAVRKLRRELLGKLYGLPRLKVPPAGRSGSLRRVSSPYLSGLERRTGKLLWRVRAKNTFRHNAIALGNGKVFCVDRLPAAALSYYKRRGIPLEVEGRVLALDIGTGDVQWISDQGGFGTWLGFSEQHDVLLEGGSSARDRMPDETGKGMMAYRGSNGEILWKNDKPYGGPCILLGRRIITQAQSKGGFALDLLTGRPVTRVHPLSGENVPWSYTRKHGCNTAIGCPNLLTFRSAAAGYYDLAGDGGTGNFGGFRSGCTSNLIPAGGILNAPDYTRSCTCAYQNQVSLALVHMPEVEMWTFQDLPKPRLPLERAGLNLGAPGDRRGPDGTLWLDFPSVGGSSPDPTVKISIEKPAYLRCHPSRVRRGKLPWVASSALKGSGKISVRLAAAPKDKQKDKEAKGGPRTIMVDLVFAEIEGLGPGERVFDVTLQGKVVLEGFDIVKEAGGAFRSVIREFPEIPVDGDELHIGLQSTGKAPPLLCGVRILQPESKDSP